MVTNISPAQARRIALAAQGFGRIGPDAPPAVGTRQLNRAIQRLGLLQIDSVNVFERSHYLPLYARLGDYDRTALDRLAFTPGGRYIEYWAHEAAILPVESWPLLRWRMDHYRTESTTDPDSWAQANRPLIDWLLAELAEKGPLAASAVEHDANTRTGPWWGWSQVKTGLEVLFRWGLVVSAGRTRFERVYALREHILRPELLALSIPRHEAHKQLLSHAARAHGIGTASDFADYFRLKATDALPALDELEQEGELIPVTVPGWTRRTWIHRDARVPRQIQATALLSPFDPVVWERARAERLFGF
ncbi:MAG: winged helix-turn-helix domain-containing protein, partial [Microbacteriaceae bacterium]